MVVSNTNDSFDWKKIERKWRYVSAQWTKMKEEKFSKQRIKMKEERFSKQRTKEERFSKQRMKTKEKVGDQVPWFEWKEGILHQFSVITEVICILF